MAGSTKTKKDFLKEDLLKDPYKKPNLVDIASEEDPQEYIDAIKETKSERENSKRYFDSLRKKLERE